MKSLMIDRTKLITKSAYAAMKGITAAAVTKQCKEGKLEVIRIKGGELIYLS